MGTLTWPLPNSGNMMRNTMLLLALVLVLDFAVGTYQVESMVRPAVPKPTYIRKRYGADPPVPASSNYRRRYGAEPQAPAGSAYRRRYGAVVPPAAASSNYRRRYRTTSPDSWKPSWEASWEETKPPITTTITT